MSRFITTARIPLHIIDLVKDVENDEERMLENIALKEALEKLSPRERYILIARFSRENTDGGSSKGWNFTSPDIQDRKSCFTFYPPALQGTGDGCSKRKNIELFSSR